MDSANVAILAAAIGSMFGVASQYVAHALAETRDRRNQRRERLTEVIIEVSMALYPPIGQAHTHEQEFKEWRLTLDPNSIAAEDPSKYWAPRAFEEGVLRGMTLLNLHFGVSHPLNESYLTAVVACTLAESEKSRHFRSTDETWRIHNVPKLNSTLDDARNERDKWTRSALEEIEDT